HRSQYNYDPFTLHPTEDHYSYPLVDSEDLSKMVERPRGVRMLARDFIFDSLYNPHYGYFSKQAVLLPEGNTSFTNGDRDDCQEGMEPVDPFTRPGGFDFASMRHEADFMRAVEERYRDFEEKVAEIARKRDKEEEEEEERKDSTSTATKPYSAQGLEEAQLRGQMLARRAKEGVQEREVQAMAAKQVWHTPTQIFQPYYARAIARYLVAEYKLHLYPYDDLVIYELGAGSGALAHDILDYLMMEEPEIYSRTRYRIVEISQRLAEGQRNRLDDHVQRGTVEIVNKSFLDWNEDVPEPCFVVALEILDNLAHDAIRYSTSTLEPYQAIVSIDETGDMHELWEPVQDPLIKRYLSILRSIRPASLPEPAPHFLKYLPGFVRKALSDHFPFYPNLTPPHYIPTGSLQFLDVLRRHFPLHRLVISDFDSLPDSIQGVDAPVVQTRHQGTMVAVTTYMVLQGYFDIFFPTNFPVLRDVYTKVMSSDAYHHLPCSSSSSSTTANAGKSPKEFEDPTPDDFQPRPFAPPRPSPLNTSSKLRPDYFSSSRNNVKLYSHSEFLERYAEPLRLKDGSNPMLSWYANASWFLS
ncbi:DUF185-domain-containing protein, partial [Violaceomyces palustris]